MADQTFTDVQPIQQPQQTFTDVKPIEASVKAAPETFSRDWWKEKLYSAADKILDTLPAAGGTVGGIVGGGGLGAVSAGTASAPGAIAGAALGGAAGEAAQQLGRRTIFGEGPQSSGQAATGIAKEGAIQGAIQGATEGLGAFARGPLKSAAESQYLRALKPTTLENKIIAGDIVPEMIDRGIHGSPEAIAEQAGQQASKLRPQLEAAYSAIPQNATASQKPISQLIGHFDVMKSKYVVDGQVVNPAAWDAIDGVQNVISKYGDSISPQSLRKVKQIFDEAVSEAGGYTNNDLTTNYALKAQKAAADRIREILHSSAPDAAALDKEMSFWLDVQQVSRATANRMTGQEGGLLKTFGPLGAAVSGAVTGVATGSGEKGLAAGAITGLGTYVAQAMREPAWRTTSAVVKDRLADALARGDVRMGAALLARIGVTVPAYVTVRSQPGLPMPSSPPPNQ